MTVLPRTQCNVHHQTILLMLDGGIIGLRITKKIVCIAVALMQGAEGIINMHFAPRNPCMAWLPHSFVPRRMLAHCHAGIIEACRETTRSHDSGHHILTSPSRQL